MLDAAPILAAMTDALYGRSDDPNAERRRLAAVHFYDIPTPDRIDPDAPPYAILYILESQRGYIIGGGGGRASTDWQLRIIGTREAVATAVEELPAALNRPYRHPASEVTVMQTHLVRLSAITRIPEQQGAGAGVLRFSSDLVQT